MSNVTSPIDLPVIDISDPHDPIVGKAMLDAAAKYGFLYVNSKGTDFTAEDVEHAFELVCILPIAGCLYGDTHTATVQGILCVSGIREGDLSHYSECSSST